ncbi:MAG: NAD(P)-dependent oxidoreductase [Rhodospirillales bacterium]|nr:NAD(P)-dependent oxidoreductase [Rhodospirillales bacterium]
MAEKVLLFGHTGKMGTALSSAFGAAFDVVGVNSSGIDVRDGAAVRSLVGETKPDVIINAVARLGIDHCEQHATEAFEVNALFPAVLAQCARDRGAVLVHLSSETVFSGVKGGFLTEDDTPDPVNAYGMSKYMSELVVRDLLADHYIFRLPVLFGQCRKRVHFVERMVDRVRDGDKHLRMADDIVTSPTYSRDAAETIFKAVSAGAPFGLYHVCNSGKASLYDLMTETVRLLGLDAVVEPASHEDFPSQGRKNTVTPLRQTKLPELRTWKAALADYCGSMDK